MESIDVKINLLEAVELLTLEELECLSEKVDGLIAERIPEINLEDCINVAALKSPIDFENYQGWQNWGPEEWYEVFKREWRLTGNSCNHYCGAYICTRTSGHTGPHCASYKWDEGRYYLLPNDKIMAWE